LLEGEMLDGDGQRPIEILRWAAGGRAWVVRMIHAHFARRQFAHLQPARQQRQRVPAQAGVLHVHREAVLAPANAPRRAAAAQAAAQVFHVQRAGRQIALAPAQRLR